MTRVGSPIEDMYVVEDPATSLAGIGLNGRDEDDFEGATLGPAAMGVIDIGRGDEGIIPIEEPVLPWRAGLPGAPRRLEGDPEELPWRVGCVIGCGGGRRLGLP